MVADRNRIVAGLEQALDGLVAYLPLQLEEWVERTLRGPLRHMGGSVPPLPGQGQPLMLDRSHLLLIAGVPDPRSEARSSQ